MCNSFLQIELRNYLNLKQISAAYESFVSVFLRTSICWQIKDDLQLFFASPRVCNSKLPSIYAFLGEVWGKGSDPWRSCLPLIADVRHYILVLSGLVAIHCATVSQLYEEKNTVRRYIFRTLPLDISQWAFSYVGRLLGVFAKVSLVWNKVANLEDSVWTEVITH